MRFRRSMLAIILTSSVLTAPALAIPAQAAGWGGGGGRWCESGYFGWSSFSGFKSWMDAHYDRDSKNVWQSKNDDDTWTVWCRITSSKATLSETGDTVDVSPDTLYLKDGTRMGFRSESKSGGYTVDVNAAGKIYKVHRR